MAPGGTSWHPRRTRLTYLWKTKEVLNVIITTYLTYLTLPYPRRLVPPQATLAYLSNGQLQRMGLTLYYYSFVRLACSFKPAASS